MNITPRSRLLLVIGALSLAAYAAAIWVGAEIDKAWR